MRRVAGAIEGDTEMNIDTGANCSILRRLFAEVSEMKVKSMTV